MYEQILFILVEEGEGGSVPLERLLGSWQESDLEELVNEGFIIISETSVRITKTGRGWLAEFKLHKNDEGQIC